MVLDNGRFLTQELANVTQMLEEHFRVALSANKIAAKILTDWLDEHKTVSKKDLAKVTSLEEKGDELKRILMKKLADANSLMQREDLLRLVHYNDKLVDGAEIACYHLAAVMDSWVPKGVLKKKLHELGYGLFATEGTASMISALGVPVRMVTKKLSEGHPNVIDVIRDDSVRAVVNTITGGRLALKDGFAIRRAAVEKRIPCYTSLDTMRVVLEAGAATGDGYSVERMETYLNGRS